MTSTLWCGSILRSFDFGDPKELYVDNLSIGVNSSIYDQFWRGYLSDQYSVNARVVTCYVLWDREAKEELQRRFWFFDNSIWMLNRIIDYDLNGYKPTKCEFIKIIDTSNYTKAQLIPRTRANDGTGYDDPEDPKPPITKSSEDENYGYEDDDDPCTIIVFQDPLTEAYCVSNWDYNGDGKLDICEAARVPSLGTVFKGSGIEYFDEIVYFTDITGIEAGAFSGCSNLDHIILPDNIDYIRDNAFKDCTGLTYIKIESTDPPVLGEGAFDNTNECPIYINCDYIADFRTQWPQYAHRLQCGVGPDTGDTGSTLILATSITLSVADVVDSGVDYLEGYKKFELTSTDLVNGVWADIISNARGNNSSPELSWEPVEGAAEYIVYMVDMNSPDLVVCTFLHWKASGITVTELPEGWAPSTDYIGPNPGSGVTHIYEVYVVALKEPVERLKGSVRALNPKFKEFIQGLDTDSEGNTGNILAYGKISGTFTG